MEEAAIGYQAPSVIAAGASAQSVSLLATLVNLSLSLICLKAPKLIEKIGLTKRGAIILAFINLLTWIPLVMIFLVFHTGIAPVWVAILWLINIMPGMLLSFQKDNWLSNIVPAKTLGRYLGQRLAIKSGLFLASFLLFGYMMDSRSGSGTVSFGFVFLAAAITTFIYFYAYTHMYDPAKKPDTVPEEIAPKIKFGLLDYLNELKARKLHKFITFNSLVNVSIGLSAPFYAVYMLQEQNFTYLSFTMVIAVEFLSRVISGPFWGKFADKKGNIQVLKIVSRVVPVIPLCWLFSANLGYLMVVQAISGLCWGAFDLSTQAYLYKVAPPQTKLRYIVYTRSMMLFSTAAGGLMGAFLVNNVFEIFGSKLLSIFMMSGLLRGVVAMAFMPGLIDLAVKYGIPGTAKFSLSLTKDPAARRGLFYNTAQNEIIAVPSHIINGSLMHRCNPAMEQRLMETRAAKRQLTLLTAAVRNGRKRNWALEAAARAEIFKTAEKQPAAVQTHSVRLHAAAKDDMVKVPAGALAAAPYRRPQYGNAEMSNGCRARLPAMNSGTVGLQSGAGKPEKRGGLFYNGTGWTRYKEETLKALLKENASFKPAIRPKQVIVESGYPWRNTY